MAFLNPNTVDKPRFEPALSADNIPKSIESGPNTLKVPVRTVSGCLSESPSSFIDDSSSQISEIQRKTTNIIEQKKKHEMKKWVIYPDKQYRKFWDTFMTL